jgi:hypothetical protein
MGLDWTHLSCLAPNCSSSYNRVHFGGPQLIAAARLCATCFEIVSFGFKKRIKMRNIALLDIGARLSQASSHHSDYPPSNIIDKSVLLKACNATYVVVCLSRERSCRSNCSAGLLARAHEGHTIGKKRTAGLHPSTSCYVRDLRARDSELLLRQGRSRDRHNPII